MVSPLWAWASEALPSARTAAGIAAVTDLNVIIMDCLAVQIELVLPLIQPEDAQVAQEIVA